MHLSSSPQVGVGRPKVRPLAACSADERGGKAYWSSAHLAHAAQSSEGATIDPRPRKLLPVWVLLLATRQFYFGFRDCLLCRVMWDFPKSDQPGIQALMNIHLHDRMVIRSFSLRTNRGGCKPFAVTWALPWCWKSLFQLEWIWFYLYWCTHHKVVAASLTNYTSRYAQSFQAIAFQRLFSFSSR